MCYYFFGTNFSQVSFLIFDPFVCFFPFVRSLLVFASLPNPASFSGSTSKTGVDHLKLGFGTKSLSVDILEFFRVLSCSNENGSSFGLVTPNSDFGFFSSITTCSIHGTHAYVQSSIIKATAAHLTVLICGSLEGTTTLSLNYTSLRFQLGENETVKESLSKTNWEKGEREKGAANLTLR